MKIDASTACVVLECHHGSLGIARSLGRLGVRVYGVDPDPGRRALRSRYFAGASRCDVAHGNPQESLAALSRIGAVVGGRPVLIPTSDETAVFVADHAAALRERFRFVEQDPALLRRLTCKRGNYELAKEAGVPVPETEFPRSEADVRDFCQRARFPVMLKGIDGRRLMLRAGFKMKIVRSEAELLSCYRDFEDPARPNLMLQEWIPGGDDAVWMLDGYFDDRSQPVAALVGRKLRQTPVHVGATSLGVLEANPEVLRLTVDFVRRIGYRGLLDIGYRYDARDGLYKLLDPNPRIGSTFRLFVTEDGVDMARLVYCDLTGQPLRPGAPRLGRKWLIEDRDFESCRDYRREGALPWRAWLRSYRGVQETAWFARDDLAPFWPLLAELSGGALRRLARRVAPGRSRRGVAPQVEPA